MGLTSFDGIAYVDATHVFGVNVSRCASDLFLYVTALYKSTFRSIYLLIMQRHSREPIYVQRRGTSRPAVFLRRAEGCAGVGAYLHRGQFASLLGNFDNFTCHFRANLRDNGSKKWSLKLYISRYCYDPVKDTVRIFARGRKLSDSEIPGNNFKKFPDQDLDNMTPRSKLCPLANSFQYVTRI